MVEIVWLEDPLKFTYLRESIYHTLDPRRMRLKIPLFGEQAKIVGYEVCTDKSEGVKALGRYTAYSRRVWWLKVHDRDIDPNGVYAYHWPCEAVVPVLIAPGRESVSYFTLFGRGIRKVGGWEHPYSDPVRGLSGGELYLALLRDLWLRHLQDVRAREAKG